jgi:hypothetical protein
MRLRLLTSIGACAGMTACSGAAAPSTTDVAPHMDSPRVENHGGPVSGLLRIVPVFYPGDPLQPQIERFLRGLAGSSYWTATTAEYGVGAIDVAPSMVLPDPPPAVVDDAQIGPRLSTALGGHGRLNSAYFVFFPPETTVTAGPQTSCRDFDGYHAQWSVPESAGLSDGGIDDPPDALPAEQGDADSGGPPDAEGLPDAIDPAPPSAPATFGFLYAVIARCPGRLAAIDAVTVAISHESVEMATDPLPLTFPAFSGPDVDHLVWATVSGGEVADMCESAEAPTSIDQRFVDGFMVQRTWSNAAAEANQDPCVPPVSAPYFIAVPDLDEQVRIDGSGSALTTGISLGVGESRTVDVRLSSTEPTPDWSVYAAEVGGPPSGGDAGAGPPTLGFRWDRQAGRNGDVLRLTMQRLIDSPAGGTAIGIYSVPGPSPSSPSTTWNAWYAYVAN